MWKFLVVFLLMFSVGIFGFLYFRVKSDAQSAKIELSPFAKISEQEVKVDEKINEPASKNERNEINIVLFGIDRRSREEYGYRTDIMILVSIKRDTNQVVLTSLPRDLWWKSGRLNALFVAEGWEPFKQAIYEITGKTPETYILTDFKDFSWIVDAMGGVPVTVDTTFTDEDYPVDETKGYQTISFTAGSEKLTGERALIYSRSRKGNNGEGSDWMRMKRQHKILVGMLDAVLQPKSMFNPMIVENAFKTVTQGKMDTNMSLEEAKFLWSFYKDRQQFKISSLFLDHEYLTTPPMEEYGGAWVLVSKSGNFDAFKKVIENKLNGIESATEQVVPQE